VSIASAIKARVLLMPQQKDQNFPTEQTNAMRNALKDAKNSPQVQLLGQEFGGQHSTGTRANGYKQILSFIDKQIGH
jgi:homoserine acetyltransferase